MSPRIQTVKKYTYHTKSNKVKRFRTPGGKLRFKKIKKSRNPVICGDTKVILNGLKRLGKKDWKRSLYYNELKKDFFKGAFGRAFFA